MAFLKLNPLALREHRRPRPKKDACKPHPKHHHGRHHEFGLPKKQAR
ncbi:hypothetical protein ACFC0M_03185 [Streptomyces sp. NPDC056149]|nr:hypothetical protein [Streptomyces sp. WZ-12]